MMEKVHTFGKEGNLVGIITSPDDPTFAETPGIIMLNAGLVHRVGPFRLHVDLSRILATLGFTVLRFDLSGVGDSEMRKSNLSFEERVVDEVREVMNDLSEKKGIQMFVLMGICSGARLAHRVAVADPRVSGIVLVDGYGYRTPGYYLRYYGKRSLSASKWINYLKRKCVDAITHARRKKDDTLWMGDQENDVFPPKEKTRADLMTLVGRGVNLLMIYTGGVEDYYYYHGQFRDTFPTVDFQGRLQVEFFSEATHTFTLMKDRQKLITTLCRWLQGHYQHDIGDQDLRLDHLSTKLN